MWPEYNSIGPLEISFYDSEPFGPLKALCQALPLETISSVRLHISLDPEVQDWIDILGRCTKVEEVSISTDHDPMPSFFTALNMTTDCKPLPELETCEDNHLFLGKLMYLTLSGVDFSTEDSTDTSQLQLIQSLTERQRVMPTSKRYIRILDCSIKKEWVEDLRNVALVDWDEDEGGCWAGSEEEQVDSEEDDSDEDEW